MRRIATERLIPSWVATLIGKGPPHHHRRDRRKRRDPKAMKGHAFAAFAEEIREERASSRDDEEGDWKVDDRRVKVPDSTIGAIPESPANSRGFRRIRRSVFFFTGKRHAYRPFCTFVDPKLQQR